VAEKPVPVPLLAVHVEATLLDYCARVEIRQTFANQEDTPIEATYVATALSLSLSLALLRSDLTHARGACGAIKCRYQFPLEEHNTVCELHAEIDGRKVTGRHCLTTHTCECIRLKRTEFYATL
jgi:hypothetical protein